MLGLGVISLMLGREGLLCAPAAPLFFADASEVQPSNKTAATAIRADFVMLFLQAVGNRTSMSSLPPKADTAGAVRKIFCPQPTDEDGDASCHALGCGTIRM